MKVYIVTDGQFPYGMAPVKRTICYAKALVSQGVDCKIIIFTRTEKKNVPTRNTQSKGIYEGVPFEYIGGSNLRSPIKVVAKMQTLVMGLRLLVFLLGNLNKGDVVFSYSNDKFTSFKHFVIAVTHLRNAKYVHELCELPFKGKETKSLIRSRKKILKYQFPKYDGIIAISDALVDLAKRHLQENAKVIKVPILVEYDKYAMDDLSDDELLFIFHAGSLTEQKDGLVGMLRAFAMAKDNLHANVKFICTGSKEKSPCKREIEDLIEKNNMRDDVIFTGFLSDEDMKHYLQRASLVIINKYENIQNAYCFATKLGEYMAAGKAVIISRVGEAINWVNDGEDVIVVDPSDAEQLSSAIVRLIRDKNLRLRLGKAAKVTCLENFNCYSWGERLKSFFLNL